MVTFDTPVIAPDVALICTAPSDSAVATPLAFTLAMAGALDDQVKAGCAASGTPRRPRPAPVKALCLREVDVARVRRDADGRNRLRHG